MKNTLTALALALCVGLPFVAQAKDHAPYVYTDVAPMPDDAVEQEIAELFQQWNTGLKTGKSEDMIRLYAPNAVLQPTLSNKVRSTPAQIGDYFEHFLALKPSGVINYREIRRLGDNAAMDSGVYTFSLTDAKGKASQAQARYTFVYERVDGQWKILNHHSSAMPEVQPAR